VHGPGADQPVRSVARGARWAALLVAVAAASCSRPAPGPEAAPGEWRSFEGTWSAVGERRVLQLGPGRRASVASLAGSLLLTGERGLGVGFHARAITFSDSQTGGLGRVVWTDERGDEVYSELSGGPLVSGRHVAGSIVGGTGRYLEATGAWEMEWQYVMETEEGVVQGRAIGLKGRVRLGEAARARGATP